MGNLTWVSWKSKYNALFNCAKDSKLLWLEYRIFYRILETNKYLFTCKITCNNKCNLCTKKTESIERLIFDVIRVKKLQTFYNGIKTCIIQNGIILDIFYPQRGCRQGDPISPYLFLLCAEILGTIIRNNKDIKGIKRGDTEYKISQYADDTSLFTNGSPKTLDGILRELDFFCGSRQSSDLYISELMESILAYYLIKRKLFAIKMKCYDFITRWKTIENLIANIHV